MKPITALLIGTGIMAALYYGRRAGALFNGDVSAFPTGFSPFKIQGNQLTGAVLVRIANNAAVSFDVQSIHGTVFVDSVPLIDLAVLDAFIVQPHSSVEVAVDMAVPITKSAAMTIVQLLTGLIRKKVSLTFDGWIEAEGLTIPIKKTISYGG